jgi:hypothetical protein
MVPLANQIPSYKAARRLLTFADIRFISVTNLIETIYQLSPLSRASEVPTKIQLYKSLVIYRTKQFLFCGEAICPATLGYFACAPPFERVFCRSSYWTCGLPYAQAPMAEVLSLCNSPVELRPRSGPFASAAPMDHGAKILIVDDDPQMRALLTQSRTDEPAGNGPRFETPQDQPRPARPDRPAAHRFETSA